MLTDNLADRITQYIIAGRSSESGIACAILHMIDGSALRVIQLTPLDPFAEMEVRKPRVYVAKVTHATTSRTNYESRTMYINPDHVAFIVLDPDGR